MPTVTVFLVRSGETIKELNTSRNLKLRHHQIVDPYLTPRGYRQAQDTFAALIQGICDQTPIPANRGDSDNDGVIDPLRNMACFSAPLRACQSTAMMLAATGLEQQDKLTWRYTTVEAATSPSAIPVLTINGLCAQEDAIINCGGVDAVTNAGLLHTAAATWNDTRNKSPFMEVCVKDMKGSIGTYMKKWKEDRKVYPPRRVLDVQYLYIQHPTDPWAICPLTPKVNISIDMQPIDRYLPPPRKGNIDCKLQQQSGMTTQTPSSDTYEVVTNCIYKARQVGCDVVIFIVPASVLQSVMDAVGGTTTAVQTIQRPCSVMTLTAHINDTCATVSCNVYGVFTSEQLRMNPIAAVPYFDPDGDIGPVPCSVMPPPDKDPANVPTNQWSRFPPPFPEYIPDDYPDLPPFASALTTKVPFPKNIVSN